MAIRLGLAAAAFLCVLGCLPPRGADETQLLWPDGAPWARGSQRRDTPVLYLYRPAPDHATDTAVVIASGGSYGHHGGLREEAEPTARWLKSLGITAVVVRYRVGGDGRYDHRAFLADGARAVQLVRAHADELGIAPDHIGMIGYSAGGHLAASLATRCAAPGVEPSAAPIELPHDALFGVSCRPDFVAAVYPVVTLDPEHAHRRSARNLLGGRLAASPELRDVLSVERQVTAGTAPIFIVHSLFDRKVDPVNSVLLHDALVAHGVPTELHLYADGGHGVALGEHLRENDGIARWPTAFLAWMRGLSPGRRARGAGGPSSPTAPGGGAGPARRSRSGRGAPR